MHLEGDHEESEKASNAAKKWNIVGMIFCLFWVTLVIVVIKGAGLFDEDEFDDDSNVMAENQLMDT